MQVVYKGTQLIAENLDSRALMLKNLGIEIPWDFPASDGGPEKVKTVQM